VSPSSPIKVFYLGMAITWGLVLGMLTALGLEYFERKFSSERDVESATGSQPLALVPEVSSWIGRRRLDVHWLARDPQTPYSDAINSVRGGLRFIRPSGRVPSVIMVSSAASGEGKSTFSASLATAAARSGQSVVLVDADLRRPGVARTFKVKPRATVVDVLMGRESLEDALIRIEQGRLHLLCAHPPHGGVSPVDVFEKEALESLLDLLRSRFDLVVVDTPPVNAVSDALLFANYVDVVLFLIRWRHTNSEIVMSSIKQLYDAGAPCVRCILSRINLQRYRLYGTKDYSYYKQVKVG
ncbi:MAG: polysaccharide biosynthesis tyrosine autokinase, partial [Nitrospiraceae bacterium]|nr:polysaccharide biosynthesis tyrosine autokinase [Nitrospiraceae bacterium]